MYQNLGKYPKFLTLRGQILVKKQKDVQRESRKTRKKSKKRWKETGNSLSKTWADILSLLIRSRVYDAEILEKSLQ